MNATQALSELSEAMRVLCLVQSSPLSEMEDPAVADYLAQVGELKAHQQILRCVRALRGSADDAQLQEFEAAYMRKLSSVYDDPNVVPEDAENGWGWFLVNPNAAAKLRPRLIASVAALFASQAARLNSQDLRQRLKSAPAAASACPVVTQVCGEIGAWLRSQPSVGEESLTDWLLYQLAERTAWIRPEKFTRYDESMETGADWEWWLVGDDQRGIGIRVQAKKLLGHSDLYPHLAYSNRRGLQIEMLLDSARKYEMLPFFLFYHVMPSMPPVKCKASTHAGPHGAFIADAVELYEKWIKVGRQWIDAERLLADANPLSCMFCCAATISNGPYFEKVYDYIRRYHPVAVSVTPHGGLHAQVPAHVQALLRSPEGESTAWIHSQFRERLQNVSALLVFDLRTERAG